MDPNAPASPKNAIVVLLDSLNRHMLGAYGGGVCDAQPRPFRGAGGALPEHYAGSLPCMPARHDILCGAMDFLWRPWGSIEIWEDAITVPMREAGIASMLVSDHPHLFEVGGENYHTDFMAWEYERGHESDPWKTRPDTSWLGTPTFGRAQELYQSSTTAPAGTSGESAFPGPGRWRRRPSGSSRTPATTTASSCSSTNSTRTSRSTRRSRTPRCTTRRGRATLIWPPYHAAAQRKGVLTERQAHQVRACYGGKLTMIDHWFGKLMDAIEAPGTVGRHRRFRAHRPRPLPGREGHLGKPGVPVYEPLGTSAVRVVAGPGAARCRRAHDVRRHPRDARRPVRARGRTPDARQVDRAVPGGDSGGGARLGADGGLGARGASRRRAPQVRARPAGENFPLSMWSNRWSTMPAGHAHLRLPRPDERAWLDRMPGTKVPVIRQPFEPGDMIPYWAMIYLLATTSTTSTTTPRRTRTARGKPSRPRWRTSSARRCWRWRPPRTSSRAWDCTS